MNEQRISTKKVTAFSTNVITTQKKTISIKKSLSIIISDSKNKIGPIPKVTLNNHLGIASIKSTRFSMMSSYVSIVLLFKIDNEKTLRMDCLSLYINTVLLQVYLLVMWQPVVKLFFDIL